MEQKKITRHNTLYSILYYLTLKNDLKALALRSFFFTTLTISLKEMHHKIINLFDQYGERKYLVAEERNRFIAQVEQAECETRIFCLLLHYTGIRISEGINLLISQIDYENKVVIIESLKKSKRGVYRTIPLPSTFLDELNLMYDIKKRQRIKGEQKKRVWKWTRNTAYLKVKKVMKEANIFGTKATPKGLRHGFAIHCLEKKIPLNMISKWMGHSSIEVTAIYQNALGEEERRIASRLWK